jgi:hypothetical protein
MLGGDLLAIYLQDHHAGSVGGLELAKRARGANEGTELGDVLKRIAAEIEADKTELEGIMARLGVGHDRLKVAAGWTAEKAGRLKLNGSLLSYSPLSRVVELEGLIAGIVAKQLLWRALRQLSERDSRLDPVQLDRLAERAERQVAELRAQHERAALDALTAPA